MAGTIPKGGRLVVGAFVLLPLLAACGGDSPGRDEETPEAAATADSAAGEATTEAGMDPADVRWALSLGIDFADMERRESGLYVQVLEEGAGPQAAPGDSMGVHYTVWLPDGSKLDSSLDHTPPDPLSMRLGETALIEGWTEGVTGMRLGERRRLVVPAELAYGSAGRPPQIPPHTPLAFEVELARHVPGG